MFSTLWYKLICVGYPSQDSSIGSVSAWYCGGPGFKSWQEFFCKNKKCPECSTWLALSFVYSSVQKWHKESQESVKLDYSYTKGVDISWQVHSNRTQRQLPIINLNLQTRGLIHNAHLWKFLSFWKILDFNITYLKSIFN